eukprot:TRINITY_DN62_c0_g1_i2.p6 TRINITY_DN62_c0_g1~~TRINITY_DN62_c0_g1_i2.p6  ORF type:complete len:166 (-),score=3.24 TRINITY_DN62_c0_g1_i2:2432-2929(-)
MFTATRIRLFVSPTNQVPGRFRHIIIYRSPPLIFKLVKIFKLKPSNRGFSNNSAEVLVDCVPYVEIGGDAFVEFSFSSFVLRTKSQSSRLLDDVLYSHKGSRVAYRPVIFEVSAQLSIEGSDDIDRRVREPSAYRSRSAERVTNSLQVQAFDNQRDRGRYFNMVM